jgi:hypothetical protein
MARRPNRTKLVHRLVSPIAAKIRRRIPRIRRQFPPMPRQWSLARRLVARPAGRAGRDRT